ncbi:palladin-like isoform X2 [Macrobrachium nipponense]|uniref:palladin-like isoform X2 n=1 Tax=Macrobrachium nipponense TaxID=159736 RepID=UPI0030C7F9B4
MASRLLRTSVQKKSSSSWDTGDDDIFSQSTRKSSVSSSSLISSEVESSSSSSSVRRNSRATLHQSSALRKESGSSLSERRSSISRAEEFSSKVDGVSSRRTSLLESDGSYTKYDHSRTREGHSTQSYSQDESYSRNVNKMGKSSVSAATSHEASHRRRDSSDSVESNGQIDGIAPTFSQKPVIKQEEGGKHIKFECRILAEPKPAITWYRDGLKVQESARCKVSIEKDEKYFFITLSLANVTVQDAGKYKITAKNELGESNATISLNFDSDEEAPAGDGVKPTFTERPVIRQSEDGSSVIFSCRCVGSPKPTVIW